MAINVFHTQGCHSLRRQWIASQSEADSMLLYHAASVSRSIFECMIMPWVFKYLWSIAGALSPVACNSVDLIPRSTGPWQLWLPKLFALWIYGSVSLYNSRIEMAVGNKTWEYECGHDAATSMSTRDCWAAMWIWDFLAVPDSIKNIPDIISSGSAHQSGGATSRSVCNVDGSILCSHSDSPSASLKVLNLESIFEASFLEMCKKVLQTASTRALSEIGRRPMIALRSSAGRSSRQPLLICRHDWWGRIWAQLVTIAQSPSVASNVR